MSAATQIKPDNETRIPVIDIAPFLANEPGATAALAARIVRTCLDTGFLVIANHGVPQPIIDRAFAAAADFFALDEASKLALRVGAENIGYLPYGGQTVRTSTVHRNTKPTSADHFTLQRGSSSGGGERTPPIATSGRWDCPTSRMRW